MANTNTSKVFIDIITEFTGTKSLKNAENSFSHLAKSVKRLVSVVAIEEFARASVKAFLADDAAAQKLGQTLGNLGLAYERTNSENFIAGLERTYNVLDDYLRPAFAKLIQVTGSYSKSKELLTAALNASAGAGVDLTTTVQDLSQAYVGNLKGLKKYNLGLTNAELAAMSFQQILDLVNRTFAGQGLLAASTYAGQMTALTIGANNAKEVIGKGLVDALTMAAGEKGNIQGLVDSMITLANAAANVAKFFGMVFGGLKLIGDWSAAHSNKAIAARQNAKNAPYDPMNSRTPGLSADAIKNALARAQADRDAALRQKQLIALTRKQMQAAKELTKAAKDRLVAEKASLILKAAGKVLDTDQAGILAALNRNLTEDERNRLLLQQALLNENADAAAKLAQTIIQTQLDALALGAQNPLNGWNENIASVISSLLALQAEIAKVSGAALTMAQELAKSVGEVIVDAGNTEYDDAKKATEEERRLLDLLLNGSLTPYNPLNPNSFPDPNSWMSGTTPYNPLNDQSFPTTINVLIDPIALTGVVTNGQQTSTASGVQLSTTRVNALG